MGMRELQINDLVLVIDENMPRGERPLGRILNTFLGNDERVRVVEVKTKNSRLRRPIMKLILLEE